MVTDPRLAPTSGVGVAGIVALCGLAVLLSGAMQIGIALLGMARLARIVPQPVLAGFMNSAALLVVLSQVPLLLDLPLGTRPAWDGAYSVSYTHLDVYKRQQAHHRRRQQPVVVHPQPVFCLLYTSRCV